jgi:hypothetical protein
MNWAGHWHGYGPWTGTRSELAQEDLRRPGTDPGDEQTRAFLASALPPMMTGHWLLRRNQVSADRTWTDVRDAITWLTYIWADKPPLDRPDGLSAYAPLEVMTAGAERDLSGGSDTVWAYYQRSGAYVSYEVVSCPSHPFHPGIPCPLPRL